MRFQYLYLALLSWVLTGCVTTQTVGAHSSLSLCDAYARGMDPVIKDELVRRGHADCTTPAAVAQRRAAQAEFGNKLLAASQLLKDSQPKPINCTSTQFGNQVRTTCY
jgi:hypothetical protein